ncbi:MAG: barstar family protein [Coriobacteriales bacterium]|jgi:RNAse (barnase) inhibitor barstar
MRQIEIRETEYPGTDDASRAALHARLASELGFPSYYGANLDALNDCLEELDEPTEVTVVRATEEDFIRYENLIAGGDGEWTWFDKLCRCLERATGENDELEVTFAHEVTAIDFDDFVYWDDDE